MPSASQTRRRELARLKARREAERRRARRRRALLLYGGLGVVILVAGVAGITLRGQEKPKPAAQSGQDARIDVPTAPATVACGGKTPPRVQHPKLDRAPKGTGEGGPGYNIPDELPKGKDPYKKYTIAMANSGPDTSGSQFFISTQDNGTKKLQSNYTLFGKVVKGQDVIDKIARIATSCQRGDTPTEAVWIETATVSIT